MSDWRKKIALEYEHLAEDFDEARQSVVSCFALFDPIIPGTCRTKQDTTVAPRTCAGCGKPSSECIDVHLTAKDSIPARLAESKTR